MRDSLKLEMIDKEVFAGDYESVVLEQWKTCIAEANGISEKRNNANNIFITLNTALFAVITFSFDYKSILLSAIGLAICILWICTINSYKKLNSVKYEIINEIELKLPLAPFTSEWDRLKNKYEYIRITKIEKFIPWMFFILYSISILYPAIKGLLMSVCSFIGG